MTLMLTLVVNVKGQDFCVAQNNFLQKNLSIIDKGILEN